MGQDAPAEAARALCILEFLLRRKGLPFHGLCSALASSTGLQIALTGLNNPYMRAYRYGRPLSINLHERLNQRSGNHVRDM